mmetsp:Transcript_44985/g.124702  ORF Transcript_44985/g.124702 Transcript_44985/m.124702 type:complete len:134 (-) Transcript_44985:55-456(-)
MFECLHTYTPFSQQGTADDDWQIIQEICEPEHVVDFDSLLSDHAPDLMRGLLTHDPINRSDAATLRAHAYFKDLSWEALLNKKLSPPYVPKCADPFDVSNFEPDIEPDLTGEKLLSLEAGPYPADAGEWDENF